MEIRIKNVSVSYINKYLSTDCIAVEKENSMCQAVLLLYYVERVGAIEVSISL